MLFFIIYKVIFIYKLTYKKYFQIIKQYNKLLYFSNKKNRRKVNELYYKYYIIFINKNQFK